jgi:hypothetical protein
MKLFPFWSVLIVGVDRLRTIHPAIIQNQSFIVGNVEL